MNIIFDFETFKKRIIPAEKRGLRNMEQKPLAFIRRKFFGRLGPTRRRIISGINRNKLLVAMGTRLALSSSNSVQFSFSSNFFVTMEFRDNIDLSRVERYGSNEQSPELFQSQNLNDLKPYYNGELVNSRMAEVRKSITYIRDHWDDRAKFARVLAEFLAGRLNGEAEQDFIKRVDLIKNEDPNWGDIDETQLEKTNFNVIRLYTSETGYNKIFGIMNSLFRYDNTTNDPKTIQTIVFLVELLNIDLYNLCLKNKSCNNFTGIVYRGVGLKDEDFDAFKSLMKKEIQQRYIAIPLCLMSSTTNIEMAKRFVCTKPNAILFKIHILEMKPRYLQHYK